MWNLFGILPYLVNQPLVWLLVAGGLLLSLTNDLQLHNWQGLARLTSSFKNPSPVYQWMGGSLWYEREREKTCTKWVEQPIEAGRARYSMRIGGILALCQEHQNFHTRAPLDIFSAALAM